MDAASAFIIIFIFATTVAMTVGTGYIADRKGRNFLAWAAVGFFLGIIGLILAAVVPRKTSTY